MTWDPEEKQKAMDEICSRIAEGETLRQICRDEHMPSWRAVYDWINDDAVFASRFARARELGFDAIAHEALEIANTPILGEETEEEGDKLKVKRSDMLGHRKLMVETRLKLLAKWDPKRYGDRQQHEITGKDGAPVQIETTFDVSNISTEALAEIMRAKDAADKG